MITYRRLVFVAAVMSAAVALPIDAAAQSPASRTKPNDGGFSSPTQAAWWSLIPGYSQHRMGYTTSALLIEGAFLGGFLLCALGGSDEGSSSSNGYVPPGGSFGASQRFAIQDHGGGHGNGDGGITGAEIAGIAVMAGSIAWSVIDASSKAKRMLSPSSEVPQPEGMQLGLGVLPAAGGGVAALVLRF